MKLETGGIRKLLWDINRKEPGSKNSILTHLKPTDLKHKEKPGGGGGPLYLLQCGRTESLHCNRFIQLWHRYNKDIEISLRSQLRVFYY